MDMNEVMNLVEKWDKRGFVSGDNPLVLDVCRALKDACDKYRALYEGAEKRLQLYRDISCAVVVPSMTLNKDAYNNEQDLCRAYSDYLDTTKDKKWLTAWLFMRHDDGKEHADE